MTAFAIALIILGFILVISGVIVGAVITRGDDLPDKLMAIGVGLVIGALLAAAPVGFGISAANWSVTHTHELTITGKESVSTDDGHEYRVYTDHGTYVVKDTLWGWNWRASDRYNALKANTKYVCETHGIRSGFLSAFPNLYRCEVSP